MKNQISKLKREPVRAYSDIFIKYLLGSEDNNPILLKLINAVLKETGYPEIVSVEIINPFNLREFQSDKETILDVKARDENGYLYDIEIQVDAGSGYVNRSLYYWSKLYGSQMYNGEIYERLSPVISINILRDNIFAGGDFFTSYLLKERSTNAIITNHLSINYIELGKLATFHPGNFLETFGTFLKSEGDFEKMNDTEIRKIFTNDPILKEAHEKYLRFTGDAKLREAYENRLKVLRDKASALYDADRKGFERGIEQGIEQGIEKESRAVRKMRASGFPDDKIVELTEFDLDFVKSVI